MQQSYSCPNCKAPAIYGSQYCPNCGTQFTWPQQTPIPPSYNQAGSYQYQQAYYGHQQQFNQRMYSTESPQRIIPNSIINNFPAMVKTQLSRLPAEKQDEFLQEYKRRKKSTVTAYILWFLLGWHYAYLGKWGIQFLFWITAGGLFGGLLIFSEFQIY